MSNQKVTRFKSDNGKYGFKNEKGEIVIEPKYDSAQDFSEGLALVHIKYKYGFIDETGKEIIPPRYDRASPFSEGLAAVTTGSSISGHKYGFIDKTGREVIPLEYFSADSFSEGLAPVARFVYGSGSDCGYIDKNNNTVIPFQFKEAKRFTGGIACVSKEFGRCYGIIDWTGKTLLDFKYDSISVGTNGVVSAGTKFRELTLKEYKEGYGDENFRYEEINLSALITKRNTKLPEKRNDETRNTNRDPDLPSDPNA